MTWLRVFAKCIMLIALIGLILFGFFFAAVLVSDFIHLRPDAICGLMLLLAIAIATVRVLIEAAKDEP